MFYTYCFIALKNYLYKKSVVSFSFIKMKSFFFFIKYSSQKINSVYVLVGKLLFTAKERLTNNKLCVCSQILVTI